jgi:hypothetical protein
MFAARQKQFLSGLASTPTLATDLVAVVVTSTIANAMTTSTISMTSRSSTSTATTGSSSSTWTKVKVGEGRQH